MHTYPVYQTGITLAEMPNNISCYIQLANCNIKCKGCHSKFLWKKISQTDLQQILSYVIASKNKGADMFIVFGDINNDISSDDLLLLVRSASSILPVCIYSGADNVEKALGNNYAEILPYLSYIKIGKFNKNLGGLANRNTNQQLFLIKDSQLTDVTKNLFKGD